MDFTPTPEMFEAIGNVKKCKEIENSIRPIVLKYKTKILKRIRVKPDENARKFVDLPNVILNPKDVWALKKTDLQLFNVLCRMERDNYGFAVEEDTDCPLLVAESQTIEAQQALMKILEQITSIPIRELNTEGLDRYMEYLYLALKQLDL